MKAKIEAEYGRVKVIVKTWTDMWICRGIELSDTMDELKAKIQSAYCIPPEKQRVFFDAFEGSLGLTIFVTTLSGKTIELDVAAKGIVYDVKVLLLSNEGIPLDQQRLIYAGQELVTGRNLSDYAIPDKATLQLVCTPPRRYADFRDVYDGEDLDDVDGQDHSPRR